MSERDTAYDVAFATVVADMIAAREEIKQGNIDSAREILNESIEKNQESASAVFPEN